MTTNQVWLYIVVPAITGVLLALNAFLGIRAERAKDEAEADAKKRIAAIHSDLTASVRQNIQLIGSLQSLVVANRQNDRASTENERIANTPSTSQPISTQSTDAMAEEQRKDIQARLLKSADRTKNLLDEDTALKKKEKVALERAAKLDEAHSAGISKIVVLSMHAVAEIAKVDSGRTIKWDGKPFPPRLTFTEYELRGRGTEDELLATAEFSLTVKVTVRLRHGLVKSPAEILTKEGIGSYGADTDDPGKPIITPAVLVQFVDVPTNKTHFAYYESTGPVTTPPFSDHGDPKALENRIYGDLADCVANLKADADFARKKQAE